MLSKYHPVANLMYTGEATENVVVKRLTDFIHRHCPGEKVQSAYKTGHSTESALPRIYDDVSRALDSGKGALMLYLDFSAAFDTLDHAKLLSTPANDTQSLWCTRVCLALVYILPDRPKPCQRVRTSTDGSESCKVEMRHGFSQGSVLGSVLFSVYTMRST